MNVFTKVRWKNFLSYGNVFTEIDFRATTSTVIVGRNGQGKSTLLDALCFGLFGKPFRKVKKDQLVNSINERECLVEIEFSANNQTYLVRRGLKPHVFEVYMNGKLINQDAKNRDYQKVLEKQILKMNYRSFTQIVVLGSATFLPFMQLPTMHRREVIEDLLDLTVFSVMRDELKQRIVHCREKINELRTSIRFGTDKIERQKGFIVELKKNNTEAVEKYKADIKRETDKIENLEILVKQKEEELQSVNTEYQKRVALEKEIANEQNLIRNCKKTIAELEKKAAFFDDKPFCPTCNQKITNDVKHEHANHFSDQIKQYQNDMASAETVADSKKILLEGLPDYDIVDAIRDDVRKFEADLNATSRFVRNLSEKLTQLLDKGTDTSEAESALRQYEVELKEIESKHKQIVARLRYFEEIDDLLSDNGIKAKIIKVYVPLINSLINKYLKDMEFFVSFHLNETFEETIKSRFRDNFSYTSFSEGEKLRIDLAILLTWREISQLKNSTHTNLLILDEVADRSLDEEGISSFMRILEQMNKNTNCFVISHNDKIRDRFDRMLMAEKEGNFSTLKEV